MTLVILLTCNYTKTESSFAKKYFKAVCDVIAHVVGKSTNMRFPPQFLSIIQALAVSLKYMYTTFH